MKSVSGKLRNIYYRWLISRKVDWPTWIRYTRKPPICIIEDGFEVDFGAGKSPFTVHQILVYLDEAHLLVDGRKYRKRKWGRRLKALLRVPHLFFYELERGDEYGERIDKARKLAHDAEAIDSVY